MEMAVFKTRIDASALSGWIETPLVLEEVEVTPKPAPAKSGAPARCRRLAVRRTAGRTGKVTCQAKSLRPTVQGGVKAQRQLQQSCVPHGCLHIWHTVRGALGSSGRDEETAPFSRTKKRHEVGSVAWPGKVRTLQPNPNSEEAKKGAVHGDHGVNFLAWRARSRSNAARSAIAFAQ
jgi:hypothetical protein